MHSLALLHLQLFSHLQSLQSQSSQSHSPLQSQSLAQLQSDTHLHSFSHSHSQSSHSHSQEQGSPLWQPHLQSELHLQSEANSSAITVGAIFKEKAAFTAPSRSTNILRFSVILWATSSSTKKKRCKVERQSTVSIKSR